MNITKFINSWLSHFDVAVSRRSNLDHLVLELGKLQAQAEAPQKIEAVRIDLLRHQIAMKWNLMDYFDRRQSTFEQMRQCPLCEYEGAQEEFPAYASQCIFEGGMLTRHQCPACDVIFGADKMLQLSDAELTQDYVWHYRAYSEGDSTELELRAFHALNPSKEGVYLNYGAGSWSKTIQILRDEGWNIFAYEPHSASSGGEAHIIADRKTLSAMKFDGLFSNNVLEHLRYPADELIFMRSLLKPAALMSHATPCFEYLYEYTRFHLFFFLGRSRNMLAQKAGLSIHSFFVEGEFMNCIYKRVEP
jgi:hypothetical protein